MLTRREEDIVEMENDEKNTELLKKWLKDKEGKRDGSDRRQRNQDNVRPPEGSDDNLYSS